MMTPEDYEVDQSAQLRKYLAILKLRRLSILVMIAVGIAAGLLISFQQTPIYEAQARITVRPNQITGWFPTAETEAAVITSEEVAQLVIADENLEFTERELLSGLSATPVSQTASVVVITYTSTDPEFAALAANAFAHSYLDYREGQQLEGLEAQREQAERRVEAIQRQINEVLQEIRRSGGDDPTLDAQYSALIARLGSAQARRDDIPSADLARAAGFGEVLEESEVPTSPVRPDPVSNAGLGAVFGLAAGMAVALLRERLDDRFKGRPDVERALQCPVLATVPKYSTGRGRAGTLETLERPRGAASEAYRNLRTSLQFILSQRESTSLIVTSPSEHEGKTATTANLGVALSQAGRRIVIVSADLRRPQMEKYFGIESKVGLSNWLLGEEDDLGRLVLQDPTNPNLRLLPSGSIPSNPAELLTSPRLAQLTDELESFCDVMLFDSPPVLPVADAVIIASHVRRVVLILNAATTRRSAAVHAKELLERVDAEVVGCVLNAFDPAGSPYYYEPYYYSRYYSAGTEESEGELPVETAEGQLRPPGRFG